MYDYRKLSPEDRRAIVELRRERLFPLHKPPHPDQGKGWYFITAATYEHRRQFTAPRELDALTHRLLETLTAAALPLAGWVVFPNHYHLLVYAPKPQAVGKALGPVHGRSSYYANQRDHAPKRQVWFKHSDRKIRSERHYWASLHYIVANPVKHGYVDQLAEWPWSCYHELLAQHGEPWIDDLVRSYPLYDFGATWDIA